MNYEKHLAALREAVELMLSGLNAHTETLSARGLGADFFTKLETDYRALVEVFNERQALKARLMEKTAEKCQLQSSVTDQYMEARKIIKIALPQETWREFGIIDNR